MKKKNRIVYFVSESTGITAESLGESLLSQFPDVDFTRHHKPFLNTVKKAKELAIELADKTTTHGHKPLVFATMPDEDIGTILKQSSCHFYELFTHYVNEIGRDIDVLPTRRSGVIHGLNDRQTYDKRMDIVNYTLTHDDAMTLQNLNEADVILVGVSRSGKTPTCLYLALHFGIRAANYPLTEDDFLKDDLPKILKDNRDKLIGLTISAKRLADIREKRRAGSGYAQLTQCKTEISHAQDLFHQYGLDVFDTTSSSIEELSARIIQVVRSKGDGNK